MIRENGRFESSPFGRSNAAKMADAESKRRRRLNATLALRWDHSALTRDHHGIGQVGILDCLAEAREKLPILIDADNPLRTPNFDLAIREPQLSSEQPVV
jgi:hypothetical protein